MKRIGRLNIIEPWEYGTEQSVIIEILNKEGRQYLMKLDSPIAIKDDLYFYLLFRLTEKYEINDLFNFQVKGTFPIEIVYKKEINEDTFTFFSINDFRSNFLFGEILLS